MLLYVSFNMPVHRMIAGAAILVEDLSRGWDADPQSLTNSSSTMGRCFFTETSARQFVVNVARHPSLSSVLPYTPAERGAHTYTCATMGLALSLPLPQSGYVCMSVCMDLRMHVHMLYIHTRMSWDNPFLAGAQLPR
jgi:hypothetical protein